MTYFLSPDALTQGGSVTLTGEEAQHLLKSRRMKAGERFALQDPAGHRYWATMESADRRSAHIQILESAPIPPLPDLAVRLWVGGVKDKAAEWIVQKATELGVAELHFFFAEHSPVSREDLSDERTIDRWERISIEACKQSDRQFPLSIAVWPALDAILAGQRRKGATWLLDASGTAPQRANLALGDGITILVGPEGGLTEKEQQSALAEGFARIKLGPLTLRTETAAIAGCAVALQAVG